MDPAVISQVAKDANQVGLLTYVVSAMIVSFVSMLGIVLWQNYKREERYAKLVETHLSTLGDKIAAHQEVIKDRMTIVEEANRLTKTEHGLMVKSLDLIVSTMTELTFIVKQKSS